LSKLADSTLSTQERLEQREHSREIAKQASDEQKQYNKTYYDKRHKVPTKYKVGEYVLIRDTVRKSKIKTGL